MFPCTYPEWPLTVGMGLTPLVTSAVVMNKKVGEKLGFHRPQLPGDLTRETQSSALKMVSVATAEIAIYGAMHPTAFGAFFNLPLGCHTGSTDCNGNGVDAAIRGAHS